MANPHTHHCTGCWNLYECFCTTAFSPESYCCPACAAIQNDTDFLHAIGVTWTDPAASRDLGED